MSIQNRIKIIMQMHNLNASAFADKIGVQRSSLSHILSGRNNPSLDFIEKTLLNFPRVDGEWLITGQQKKEKSIPPRKVDPTPDHSETITEPKEDAKPSVISEEVRTKRTVRVICFYDDGTFEEFHTKKTNK
jgi:transcriptional regulator with XRE-family HTH domain